MTYHTRLLMVSFQFLLKVTVGTLGITTGIIGVILPRASGKGRLEAGAAAWERTAGDQGSGCLH